MEDLMLQSDCFGDALRITQEHLDGLIALEDEAMQDEESGGDS